MLKKFALAITGALAIGAAPAYAGIISGEIFGFPVTVIENGAYQVDTIYLDGPSGVETIDVFCTGNGGYTWESVGPNTYGLVDGVSQEWCSTF